MLLNKERNSNRSLTLFISVGVFSILLGISAILGWIFNIDVLKSIFPNYATMKFGSALCFVLAGSSFLLLIKYNNLALKISFIILTLCFGLFAAISLSQDVFNWNSGIDQFFFTDYSSIAKHLPHPGRMSPSTAVCFILLAISLPGVDAKNITYRNTAQYLLHFITLVTFISIIGYLLKVPYPLKFSFFSSMAVHTAIALLLLSTAASAINYELGITSLFAGTAIGNIIARRLFPRMIIILIVMGYISIELQRYDYISIEFGVILSTISFLLIGLFLIRDTLTEMNRLDQKRTEAENETQQLNKNLEAMILARTRALEQSHDRF